MHICTECGRVCDEDLDFCPSCGSKKGANVDPSLIPDEFKIRDTPKGRVIVREDFRRLRISLMLALFPGILDIFGLGHLFTRQYLKGLAFMSVSVFYYAERLTRYFGLSETTLIVISVAVFILQALDQTWYVRKRILS